MAEWRFTPSVWSAGSPVKLEVVAQKPVRFHLEPGIEPVEARPPAPLDAAEYRYGLYRLGTPAVVVVEYPRESALESLLKLLCLSMAPPVLGILSALWLRARGTPNWPLFQKLSLGLTGVLFLIYYHLTTDRPFALWLNFYFGRLQEPLMFLVMFASFVFMKWSGVLMGQV
ncbi:MAG: hypothetical protein ACREDU_08250, partial [Methylocella sp.]